MFFMANYWIIGDIHGEVRLLDSLLENLLRFKPDQIVFVGDYIDRGPYSREVIDRIMGLEIPVACLMGNHEMMMLNAMEDLGYGYNPIELWYYNGGEATLHSFGATSFFNFQSTMDPVYLEFFRKLKMNHILHVDHQLKVLVTHAGISPSIPVEQQIVLKDYTSLVRYLQENHIDMGDSFLWVRENFFESPSDLWKGYLVVHGHTPNMKLRRYITTNGTRNFLFVENDISIRKEIGSGKMVSIDIDSGSVISGRLTGLGIFIENEGTDAREVRLKSITVTSEEIVPRDLGILNH